MKKILFIRLRLLGDIIFTIPAIRIFKTHFPDVDIYYVVEEQFKEIADLIPGIREVIVIPREMGLFRVMRFRKDIGERGIDTVIDFHSGPKSAQLTWITRAKRRIGYKTPNRNWAYTHLTPRKDPLIHTHSAYNQARLLEHLGIPIHPDLIPPYPQMPIDLLPVRPFVKEILGKNERVPKAVIHIGAGNSSRDWGIEKFSLLVQRLKNDGVAVFLIGNSSEEKEKASNLKNRYNIVDFCCQLTIPELLYLISHSSIYVGADSGPLHVASLSSTPLVALYGPNLPEISGPWRKEKITIMRQKLKCQPCDQRKCIYGIIRCMNDIRVEEVYEAILRYIA